MFRKYVIITLAAVFFMGSTGCTSKKASDDSADIEAGDSESLEAAEATENNEDLDSGGEMSVADAGTSGDELAADEQLPADSGSGGGDMIAENAEDLAPGDLSETPSADSTEIAASEPPADTFASNDAPAADMGGDTPPPPAEYGSDMGGSTDMAASEPTEPATPEPAMEEAPKPVASLKKVVSQPYKQGKTLVNAYYIVRDGDTAESISQKVFASTDHVKELCRVNAYNCGRGLKAGDKMYYNSPQRPNDDTVVKSFYEDAGVQPQFYTAKQGDNIRRVGKDILGHDRSWMELWATNEVDSKGDLDEGTQLRYWPTSEIAAPALAANEPPPAPVEDAAPPMDAPPIQDQAAAPPMDQGMPPEQFSPPAEDLAMNNPPPPSDMDQGMPPAPDAGAMAGTIEPPPPPPPPPPPTEVAQAGGDMSAADANQQNFMLGVGAVLLLAAAALFISIRKKRARRQIDFNTTTQTQIE